MNAAAPRRVGLFGGAFDPPHGAHVALARAAVEQLGLDRLHVAPTGMAWHKAQPLSAAAHRLAMCRLAFGGLPKVFVDDRELRRGGPTYTIDTLAELRAQYPGAELFLQIGADQAAAFHTWRRAGEIVDMAVISIAVRADVEPCAFPFGGRGQRDEGVLPLPPLGEGWDGGHGVTTGHAAGPHPSPPPKGEGKTAAPFCGNPLPGLAVDPARVRLLQLPAMPHSATEIRRLAALGQDVGHLAPASVAGYIAEHHLYRPAAR